MERRRASAETTRRGVFPFPRNVSFVPSINRADSRRGANIVEIKITSYTYLVATRSCSLEEIEERDSRSGEFSFPKFDAHGRSRGGEGRSLIVQRQSSRRDP